MRFRKKKLTGVGSVLFRGTLPARAEEFEFLRRDGIEIRPSKPGDSHWALSLNHPRWGPAELVCLRNAPLPPPTIIEYSSGMTPKEREEVGAGRSMVSVTSSASSGDVLQDRKALLWYLRRVMGDDGVGAMDHGSQRFWPRAALDFELSHDAPLSIDAMYVVHAVTASPVGTFEEQDERSMAGAAGSEGGDGEQPAPQWVHTHGLAELDAYDFDLIDPTLSVAGDPLRALAYAVLEGTLAHDAASFQIAQPGGTIRMVPAQQFMRSAAPAWRQKREAGEDHNRQRSVVCDPVGLFARLTGGKPTPSRFFRREDFDRCIFRFSNEATAQMAERAAKTIGMCRVLHEELAEFGFSCLVKIAYPSTEGGREHLWFRVHGFGEDDVDATLLNRPFNIPTMSEGQRGRHRLDELSDWQIHTPLGELSPRDTRVARALREDPEMRAKLLEIMKMMNAMGMNGPG